jgi:hypothetical protein
MSAALPAQPELPSSCNNVPTLNPIASSRSAKPDLYSPITGVVGHTFIRVCLWFDRLSLWKKQSNTAPIDGVLNFADREAKDEGFPHSAAN